MNIYWSDIKVYAISVLIAFFVVFGFIFFYKWQTKPIENTYCGDFNGNYCKVGTCDYIKKYTTGSVGYCRGRFLGI